jgi:hypothetical protein
MAVYPCNFIYHSASNPTYLSWDAVVGASMYWIEKKDGETGAWNKLCEVPTLDYTLSLTPGVYYIKGKAYKEGLWGPAGIPEKIEG